MEGENDFQMIKETVLEFLQNSDLKNKIKYKESEVVYPGNVEREITLEGRVPKNKELALDEFRETLFDLLIEKVGNESASKFIEGCFKVQVGISAGDKFVGLDAFDLNGNKVKIEHESGKVLMIDFWATWCVYCQEPMQENVDLMTKHQNLKDKNISIVCISCDDNVDMWKNHMNERNWTVIPQYVKADIRKVVGIKGIPCVMIVNKSGVIAFIGSPKEINLEETLLNIADDKPLKRSEDMNAFWNNLDDQSKMNIVADSNFVIKDAGTVNANFCVVSHFELDEAFQVQPVKITPVFYGQVTQFEYDTIQTAAITLQTNYNFNGFDFNVKVLEIGADDDF